MGAGAAPYAGPALQGGWEILVRHGGPQGTVSGQQTGNKVQEAWTTRLEGCPVTQPRAALQQGPQQALLS